MPIPNFLGFIDSEIAAFIRRDRYTDRQIYGQTWLKRPG